MMRLHIFCNTLQIEAMRRDEHSKDQQLLLALQQVTQYIQFIYCQTHYFLKYTFMQLHDKDQQIQNYNQQIRDSNQQIRDSDQHLQLAQQQVFLTVAQLC